MTLVEWILTFFMSGAFLCALIPMGIAIVIAFICAVRFFYHEARDLKKRGL